MSKLIGMISLATMIYGISLNLLENHINFKYLKKPLDNYSRNLSNNVESSLTTIENKIPQLQEVFSFVNYNKAKKAKSFLNDMMLIWWNGAPASILAACVARVGSEGNKPTWKKILAPTIFVLSSMMLAALAIGLLSYHSKFNNSKNLSYDTIKKIFDANYRIGLIGSFSLTAYIYKRRYKNMQAIEKEKIDFSLLTFQLFHDHPNDPEVQNLVENLLNSNFISFNFKPKN